MRTEWCSAGLGPIGPVLFSIVRPMNDVSSICIGHTWKCCVLLNYARPLELRRLKFDLSAVVKSSTISSVSNITHYLPPSSRDPAPFLQQSSNFSKKSPVFILLQIFSLLECIACVCKTVVFVDVI